MKNEQEDQKPAQPKAAGQKAASERHRQVIRGLVVSDKMNKTRVIEIKRTLRHRLYQKGLVRKSRFFVHDEKNQSKVGDVIVAASARGLSRHKNFTLLKIVEKRVGE